MSDDLVPAKDEATGRFLTGNIGGGRTKGARNKLGEAFIQALHDDFNEHGVAAVQAVRAEKPDQYLKVIASLLPKEFTLNVNDMENMTDDELIQRIRQLDAAIHPFLTGGTGDTGAVGAIEAGAVKSAGVH